MGRSKNDVRSSLPVDHYRREIGKQDYKKSKSELKETKLKAQAKQTKSEVAKELFILMGVLVFVLGFIYILLYIYLEKEEGHVIKQV